MGAVQLFKDLRSDLEGAEVRRLILRACFWTFLSILMSVIFCYSTYAALIPELFGYTIPLIMPILCPLLVAFPVTLSIQVLGIRIERQSAALATRNRELRIALMETESANLKKRAFLSSASHELRTPLTSIIGYSDFLLSRIGTDISENDQTYLKTIRLSGDHLLRIIDDFMDISRVEDGKLELRIEPVDPHAVANYAIKLCERDLVESGVTARIGQGFNGTTVHCDETRLTQILVNLVGNASKYAGEGAEVEISAEAGEGTLDVHVRDNGVGMNVSEQEIALTDFGRTGTAIQSGKVGFGLGLPLVKRMTEAMGGAFHIESDRGEGCLVKISLPIE